MIQTNVITILGLFISILGTALIAIPVLPRIRVLFEFGKLREAKQSIRFSRLQQGDTGFDEVASRYIQDTDINDEWDIDDIEYISHEPKLSPDFIRTEEEETPKYDGSSTTDIIFIKYTDEGPGTTSYHHNPANFYQLFESDMRRGEEKIRFFGLFLLAVGFIFQIVGVIL